MELNYQMKIKISGILKRVPLQSISYYYFEDLLKKNKQYKMEDITIYLLDKWKQELSKENPSQSIIIKISALINIHIYETTDKYELFSKETTNRIYCLILETKEIELKKELLEKLEELEQGLKVCYPQLEMNPIQKTISEETESHFKEELLQSKETILELTKKNEQLETKLSTNQKEYTKLKKSEIELKQLKYKLETTIKQLETQSKEEKKEIQRILQQLREYQHQIESFQKMLEEQIQKYQFEQQKNIEQTKEIQDLEQQVLILTQTLEDLQQKIKKDEAIRFEQNNRENYIKEYLLNCLCQNPTINLQSIAKDLTQRQIITDISEIHQYLTSFKNKINIAGPLFDTFPPSYSIQEITPPIIKDPFSYTIGNKKELDILYFSDLHLNEFISISEEMDRLYNYAIANGIVLLLNLGDTFNFKIYNKEKTKEDYIHLENLIQNFITAIPSNTGIYQGILGGNHDEKALNLGVDPLRRISEERLECIHLGYRHRMIQVGEDKFMLSHPTQNLHMESSSNDNLKKYFNSLYQRPQENREDIYCDFIGGTHRSVINPIYSYCTLPSYRKDRTQNGCYHVKIYFNNEQKIDYMILLPLMIENNKLTPTNEFVYQKLKKR